MDVHAFLEMLYDCPVIASVKDEANLERGLASQCGIIFLLFGNVLNLPELVDRVKATGKLTLVHLDLIDGLAQRDVSVDFVATHTKADGIITTRPQLARHAKGLGLISLQRFFLLDSMAVENMRRQLEQDCCDLIEVLPGPMPKVISRLTAAVHKPVIAGGLISDKEDVTGALAAGAVAVSSTSEKIWFL
ncbi:MAG TPA: glycerol-3-phosphate responsive antiterminator [Pseudoflavonifractor sp.]|nr:glycerol-3-phosphate responsive antiterminator [Pseudoflavonifractor sp.]